MTSRPKVAARIAECIAEWADIETMLGLTLGFLLNTDSKAAMAMYLSLENRTAQHKLLLAASEAKLAPDHHDTLVALMRVAVTPVQKQRDKLAHWCWGTCNKLPNDLVLATPSHKLQNHFMALHSSRSPMRSEDKDVYVVKESYLINLVKQMRETERLVGEFAATVWQKNSQRERDEHLQKLSNEPLIRERLDRLNAVHRKNRESRQSSRRPMPSGKR
jgi:hypothetical protein